MKQPSKEKSSATSIPSQNRLSKTQLQPQKPSEFQNTQINKKMPLGQKPSMQMPPRAGSSQKINFKIEENMTNSKIHEARVGLQLLKKKMGRAGSREKPISIQKKQEETYTQKKIATKSSIQDEYNPKQIKKVTPKITEKQPTREDYPKKTPPISSKSMEDRPVKRPQQQQYINPVEQAPIKGNQNFLALLERQMAKENINQPVQKNVKKQAISQQENIELIQCSKGCGRQFNSTAIQKHQKICQKVFQSKRKAFDAASQRAPQTQDFKQPPPIPSRQPQKPKKAAQEKQEKIPKWKLQSMAFRAGLKQGRGQQISAEDKAAAEKASGMIQCGSCGRKFNQTAGKRHIAFCESKSKQMPKMNTTITKKK